MIRFGRHAYSTAVLCLLALPAIGAPMLPGNASLSVDYVAWTVEGDAIVEPLTEQAGDPEKGRVLVIDRKSANCLACHQIPVDDQSFQGNIGPSLVGVGSRLNSAQIRLRIVDERKVNPNTIMPGYYRDPAQFNRVASKYAGRTIFTAQDVEDVVAYISTLK